MPSVGLPINRAVTSVSCAILENHSEEIINICNSANATPVFRNSAQDLEGRVMI